MTRRHWLQLGAFIAAGIRQARAEPTALKAGPFAVSVPEGWKKTAIIEKVPQSPLYSSEDWKAYQADKMNTLKPGYNNRPEHWAVRLPGAGLPGKAFDPATAGEDEAAPQILIHKASQWGTAFTDGVHEDKPAAEVVESLRKELDAWATKDLPHGSPAAMDAELQFICLKKPLAFTGGRGIRMVCQWMIEPDLVRRGRLHYLFLGMSKDNTCQIIATFPLDVPGLPSDAPEAQHLGRSTKLYEALEKHFNLYETDAKHWLAQHAGEFTPRLTALDEMMQSLVVDHWQ